ncbi:MAG: VWA domain-containing protein [Deltaproteobacteria bacterium]|nr:VWA domain-containing protein [Deltaproteobacteria bacterium]
MLAFGRLGIFSMNRVHLKIIAIGWFLICLIGPVTSWAGEPRVQILSPKDGSRLPQDQPSLFVSGKVARDAGRSANVDIFLVIDTSGSTAEFAGSEFATQSELPEKYLFGGPARPAPQISISRRGIGVGPPQYEPTRYNLRHSIFGAEIIASKRLLAQLNAQSTRVGIITFAKEARLVQTLTQDFDQVRRVLDQVYWAGPNGGTNMVDGIRLGIRELMGLGQSSKRQDAIKAQLLMTDGLPSLPTGDGNSVSETDVQLTINSARLAGKAGIKIHVFGLGDEVLSFPWAVHGIAKESGGTFTPLARPADVLAVMDQVSVVGVDFVQVTNQTSGQKATQLRLAADGFFSSAVPVVEGKNQIDVVARGSDGSIGRDSITIFYQSGNQKSLELEVFLEREKKLKLEVERLGRTPAEIQRDVERNREDSLRRPQQLPPATDGPAR